MLVTAVFGFDGVKWVNYIALPLLFVICMYGLVVSVSDAGVASVFDYVPAESMGLVAGINISVGLFASAAPPSAISPVMRKAVATRSYLRRRACGLQTSSS